MIRYIITEIEKGKWFVKDTYTSVGIKWVEHHFNDTQQVSFDEKILPSNPLYVTQIAHEIGDWLRANHYNKIF